MQPGLERISALVISCSPQALVQFWSTVQNKIKLLLLFGFFYRVKMIFIYCKNERRFDLSMCEVCHRRTHYHVGIVWICLPYGEILITDHSLIEYEVIPFTTCCFVLTICSK